MYSNVEGRNLKGRKVEIIDTNPDSSDRQSSPSAFITSSSSSSSSTHATLAQSTDNFTSLANGTHVLTTWARLAARKTTPPHEIVSITRFVTSKTFTPRAGPATLTKSPDISTHARTKSSQIPNFATI
ncbi:pentatricopeptide repeat domain-containing protein 3 [Striga asiatica]|uniref:Pentatricopeptide repeat domain-containing protein 3 n=1 Tax=Striga asiatica TaxID=4170 RepID=A0A5A7QEQ9_STRAF|nr:pentatricopeptide repeat domain-containing protein 3 [Striga asiatica]